MGFFTVDCPQTWEAFGAGNWQIVTAETTMFGDIHGCKHIDPAFQF